MKIQDMVTWLEDRGFTVTKEYLQDSSTYRFVVTKAGLNVEYDPEKGLAMAICKKVMGNKGNYNNEINKWTDQYWEKMKDDDKDYIWPLFTNPDYGNELMRATESIKKASENLNKLTSNVFGTDK